MKATWKDGFITCEGKGGITAKIIADSCCSVGNRITTFELTYHRYVHSELMTHRLFSRNAMSSRAVPVKKMIEQVLDSPARPIHWGLNQAGMQADKQVTTLDTLEQLDDVWTMALISAVNSASELSEDFNIHKQVASRLLEPFQMMKTVLTATEFDNFFWLRLDKDADPHIQELAMCMKECYDNSIVEHLESGQWHTPYVAHSFQDNPAGYAYTVKDSDDRLELLTLEEAKAISASCCAQVSYRTLNNTKEKALDIYSKLMSGNKVHASPFEHQATPMEHSDELSRRICMMSQPIDQDTNMWEDGVTHVDRKGSFWSGNLKGFVQHRQLLDNHYCDKYKS